MLRRLATIVLKSGVSLGGFTIDDRNLALAIPARVLPLDAVLSEAQVNAALKACLDGEASFLATDHVELRRWLVDRPGPSARPRWGDRPAGPRQ